MRDHIRKKALAALLSMAMICSVLPAPVFAAGAATQSGAAAVSEGTVIDFAGHEWYALGAPGAGGNITLLAKNREFGFIAFK